MPEKRTLARASKDKRQGKAATTQAGEFVREEMNHAKRGKHPVKSRKQAIAIGLSKARESGVSIPDRRAASKKTAAKKATKKTAVKKATPKKATPKKAVKKTATKKTATKKATKKATRKSR